MDDSTGVSVVEVTDSDRELFVVLMGWTVEHREADFARIRNGEFDHWRKMKLIARHRIAATRTPSAETTRALVEALERSVDDAASSLELHARGQPERMVAVLYRSECRARAALSLYRSEAHDQ